METIQNLLRQVAGMQWSDYLDIFLVALLIYLLLPMIKTTGTIRVVRVVVALLLITALTEALKLYTIHFLLRQILQVGLLALVVLFQPELRRMLDHLGSMRFQKLFGIHRDEQVMVPVITQTVAACEAMSREKVGALIVFERESPMDEFMRTGTTLDAQVSEQLIRNIFFVKAPLHDGAMIVRDGRIAAAGCVLPLSSSDRLSADLGTRHRAGVGMSEVSDAVVVIVSEETGAISVAVGGMLKRHLAPQTLERLLCNELIVDDEKEKTKTLRLRLHKKEKGGNGDEE